jgi:integrase
LGQNRLSTEILGSVLIPRSEPARRTEDGKTRKIAHGLRKTAVYFLYNAGGSLSELQAIGGWTSISALQKYIQEVEQDEQAVSAMPKVAAVHAKTRARAPSTGGWL